MKFDRSQLKLYAITISGESARPDFEERVEAALKGGVTMLQLREKELDTAGRADAARRLAPICRRYGVPLIVDDDLEAALQAGADGVHVGLSDEGVEDIRKKTGSDFIIGATAKTVVQAMAAEVAGADYIGCGALFPTKTKKNPIMITPDDLKAITASVGIPAVAIGGINRDNADAVRGTGAAGISVVTAIFEADDVCEAARELRAKAEEVTA